MANNGKSWGSMSASVRAITFALNLVWLTLLAIIAPLQATSQELFGENTLYIEEESPFAKSGISNQAMTLLGPSGKGAFAFRCTDDQFLHYINPLGSEAARDLRLGDPNTDVSVRVAIEGEISEITALVSPTGASITGEELVAVSLRMILSKGVSDFAFSIAGRGGEVISKSFSMSEEEKVAHRLVAKTCGLG